MADDKNPVGRPTSFKPEYVKQAQKLAYLGATDANLADFFEVTINTIDNWKARYPEFLGALKYGKDEADNRVERSLYTRANGYTFDSLKVFCNKDGEVTEVPVREHVPPDTTACIFWLKNRRKEAWRDRHEFTGEDGGPMRVAVTSMEPQDASEAWSSSLKDVTPKKQIEHASGR